MFYKYANAYILYIWYLYSYLVILNISLVFLFFPVRLLLILRFKNVFQC